MNLTNENQSTKMSRPIIVYVKRFGHSRCFAQNANEVFKLKSFLSEMKTNAKAKTCSRHNNQLLER